jgi:hypothetical protein
LLVLATLSILAFISHTFSFAVSYSLFGTQPRMLIPKISYIWSIAMSASLYHASKARISQTTLSGYVTVGVLMFPSHIWQSVLRSDSSSIVRRGSYQPLELLSPLPKDYLYFWKDTNIR